MLDVRPDQAIPDAMLGQVIPDAMPGQVIPERNAYPASLAVMVTRVALG